MGKRKKMGGPGGFNFGCGERGLKDGGKNAAKTGQEGGGGGL